MKEVKRVTVCFEYLYVQFDTEIDCNSDVVFSSRDADCIIFINDNDTNVDLVRAQMKALLKFFNKLDDNHINAQIDSYDCQRKYYNSDVDYQAKLSAVVASFEHDVNYCINTH